MLPLHVERFLIRIAAEAKSGDFEAAHIAEDQMHHEVLLEISKADNRQGELARLALRSTEILFRRVCS